MMYPYWYEHTERIEQTLMIVGFLIMVLGIWDLRFSFVGLVVMFMGLTIQHFRFKRHEKLISDPLRCECGGHFVPPWDLGFDAPADHLICDNENGLGPLGACTNWIVTPPDYPLLQNPNQSAEVDP